MLKIRRSRDHIIFNMGVPIPEKDGLNIDTAPGFFAGLDDISPLTPNRIISERRPVDATVDVYWNTAPPSADNFTKDAIAFWQRGWLLAGIINMFMVIFIEQHNP